MFKKFIDTCLKCYTLDLCHYPSPPALSWNALLKITGVELEKNSHIDTYLFIEKRLRGGISYIDKRHSKVNRGRKWGPKSPPYQFFQCNFYKHRN